jgi:putative ABC transport system substrate-binding protein
MKRTITYVALLGTIATLFVAWLSHKRSQQDQQFTVAVVSIVEIEPIAELRNGFKEQLLNSPFAKRHKVEYREYNAQGDAGLVNQIADKIAADHPNLIYALGTPVAQAIQKRAPDILLVQGAVTDPVSAGLADAWSGSGRKYLATSDLPPIDIQANLIQTVTPNLKRLGIIYNPSEANSVAVISRFRNYVRTNDSFVLIEKPIANSSDVATVLAAFQNRVDGIYLPPDNTAHAAIPAIGRFCRDNKLPLYATVKNALDAGALATLSLDFVQLGKESADLALDALNGADPGKIPIKVNEHPTISINERVARELGIDLEPLRKRNDLSIIRPVSK